MSEEAEKIDWDRVAEILKAGGKIFVSQPDFDILFDIAVTNKCPHVMTKVIASPYMEKGTFVACNMGELGFDPFSPGEFSV